MALMDIDEFDIHPRIPLPLMESSPRAGLYYPLDCTYSVLPS